MLWSSCQYLKYVYLNNLVSRNVMFASGKNLLKFPRNLLPPYSAICAGQVPPTSGQFTAMLHSVTSQTILFSYSLP